MKYKIILWFLLVFLWINITNASESIVDGNMWSPSYLLKWVQGVNNGLPSFIKSNCNLINWNNDLIWSVSCNNTGSNDINIIDFNNGRYLIFKFTSGCYSTTYWSQYWGGCWNSRAWTRYIYLYDSNTQEFTNYFLSNWFSWSSGGDIVGDGWLFTIYNNKIYITSYGLNNLHEYDISANTYTIDKYSLWGSWIDYIDNINNYIDAWSPWDSLWYYYNYISGFLIPQQISQGSVTVFYQDLNIDALISYNVILDDLADNSFGVEYFNLILTNNNLEFLVSVGNKTRLISEWIAYYQWDYYAYNTANTSGTIWGDLDVYTTNFSQNYYTTNHWLKAVDISVINGTNYLYYINNNLELILDAWAIVTIESVTSPNGWDSWDSWDSWSWIDIFTGWGSWELWGGTWDLPWEWNCGFFDYDCNWDVWIINGEFLKAIGYHLKSVFNFVSEIKDFLNGFNDVFTTEVKDFSFYYKASASLSSDLTLDNKRENSENNTLDKFIFYFKGVAVFFFTIVGLMVFISLLRGKND